MPWWASRLTASLSMNFSCPALTPGDNHSDLIIRMNEKRHGYPIEYHVHCEVVFKQSEVLKTLCSPEANSETGKYVIDLSRLPETCLPPPNKCDFDACLLAMYALKPDSMPREQWGESESPYSILIYTLTMAYLYAHRLKAWCAMEIIMFHLSEVLVAGPKVALHSGDCIDFVNAMSLLWGLHANLCQDCEQSNYVRRLTRGVCVAVASHHLNWIGSDP